MKSQLHGEMIRRGLIWLSNIATQRGFRGCEEVILGDGYVADGVAIQGLQYGWEKKLVGEARKINQSDDYTFILESKVSRSDFQNTFVRGNHGGDRLTPKGNFHFVVAAKGIVKVEEVPTFWGLLEQSGNGLRLVKRPVFVPQSIESLYEIAYRVLRYTKHGKFSVHELCYEQPEKNSEQQIEVFE